MGLSILSDIFGIIAIILTIIWRKEVHKECMEELAKIDSELTQFDEY